MNDTLKAAGRIGAELGAAKAECERLRELLRDVEFRGLLTGWEPGLIGHITAALSQQDEPTDTFTAVDMATAAAQGFRDGQKAEPAPAQDEREAKAWPALAGIGRDSGHPRAVVLYLRHEPSDEHLRMIQEALRTRPAQTERQPISRDTIRAVFLRNGFTVKEGQADLKPYVYAAAEELLRLNTAPIAQTAPQHPDDAAVDRFAAAMKAKLAKSRAKGRGGWDDPNVCSVEFLAKLLVEHLGKGNAGTFEDVANFAMMLHQRGADPMVLAEAAEAPIKKARGEALELGVRALESKSEHTEPAPAQDELDPIEKAALDARLRRDFEARWPVPKGVIWGAAVGDYCLSEFAQGIALSYPDMWMAYKAGSERGKA